MENVCPLCNAMEKVEEACPSCGEIMLDGGAVNNYLGPYSPYAENDFLPFQTDRYCIHLLYCPVCGYDTQVLQAMMTI
ncbi:hypothetical protein [Sporomusa aerivorans]|uniref:hypothetical protein n=1 Tax=Sporomusa aerivorans TaxID=204936 RepID=UPI00352BBFC8